MVYALTMQTFPLGSFDVGRVGYGAMQLPGPGVLGPPRDHDEAIAVLRRVVELDINHIDTAQFYGPNVANELIREALHPYPADLALVSNVGARRDEAGAWLPAQEPDQLRASIEENLRTLDTDRLAAVNLRVHDENSDPNAPAQVNRELFDRQLDAMIKARDWLQQLDRGEFDQALAASDERLSKRGAERFAADVQKARRGAAMPSCRAGLYVEVLNDGAEASFVAKYGDSRVTEKVTLKYDSGDQLHPSEYRVSGAPKDSKACNG